MIEHGDRERPMKVLQEFGALSTVGFSDGMGVAIALNRMFETTTPPVRSPDASDRYRRVRIVIDPTIP